MNQKNEQFVYSSPDGSKHSTLDNNQDFSYNAKIERITQMKESSIGPTDSEITLCRVKRENCSGNKKKVNNWAVMHDLAIPGDGTHLGDSPSMVNLVAIVAHVPNQNEQKAHGECLEYMVPLSSWEPTNNTCHPSSTQLESISANKNQNDIQVDLPQSSSLDSEGMATITLSNISEETIVSLEPLGSNQLLVKQRSVSSIKHLIKRMAFWKRKSKDRDNGSSKTINETTDYKCNNEK